MLAEASDILDLIIVFGVLKMKSLNRVELLGNITQDLELKQTQSGKAYINITVATNERRVDKQTGQSTDVSEFHRCKAWGTLAENIAKFLHKGSPVMVTGKLHYDTYEKDGQKRYITEIIVNDLIMLPSGKGGNGGQSAAASPSKAYGGGYGQQQGGYGQAQQAAGGTMRPMYDEHGQPLQQQGAAPAGAPINDDIPF